MSDLCRLIWCGLIGLFRSRAALEAEILVLRHQLNVLRRKSPKRVSCGSIVRLLLVGLYRLALGVLDALKIIRPETLMRWHRAGFRAYWRWKSRPRGGRPTTPGDIRRLIREMSVANPLWGAPRIHGEFLKLGIDVGQTTVAKYMARRRMPPSPGWKTFLRNHADGIASMDLFLVPTISFRFVRIANPATQSSQASVAGCNRASERRMDCPAIDRGMRVATGTPIYHSRPGSRLRRCLCPTASSDGHTRSTNRTTLTMAEWICGEADRIDPAGLQTLAVPILGGLHHQYVRA